MKKTLVLLSFLTFLGCSNSPTDSLGSQNSHQVQMNSGTWYIQPASVNPTDFKHRKMLFVDPESRSSIALIQQEPIPLNQFEVKQLTQKYNDNGNSDYCAVFILEAKASEKPTNVDPGCEPRYTVQVDGTTVASFPVYYPINTGTNPDPVNYYQVYAPCSGICDTPLNITVTKTPGDQCQLLENGQYSLGDPTQSNSTFGMCPAPESADSAQLYHSEYLANLLDSSERRLTEIESNIDSLIKATQAQFPDVGEPPTN